jgi:hypothetical protein
MVCGLPFSWRSRWKDCWEEVRYCSQRCRSRKLRDSDQQLESQLVELLRHGRRSVLELESRVTGFTAMGPPPDRQAIRMALRRLCIKGVIRIPCPARTVDGMAPDGSTVFEIS